MPQRKQTPRIPLDIGQVMAAIYGPKIEAANEEKRLQAENAAKLQLADQMQLRSNAVQASGHDQLGQAYQSAFPDTYRQSLGIPSSGAVDSRMVGQLLSQQPDIGKNLQGRFTGQTYDNLINNPEAASTMANALLSQNVKAGVITEPSLDPITGKSYFNPIHGVAGNQITPAIPPTPGRVTPGPPAEDEALGLLDPATEETPPPLVTKPTLSVNPTTKELEELNAYEKNAPKLNTLAEQIAALNKQIQSGKKIRAKASFTGALGIRGDAPPQITREEVDLTLNERIALSKRRDAFLKQFKDLGGNPKTLEENIMLQPERPPVTRSQQLQVPRPALAPTNAPPDLLLESIRRLMLPQIQP